MALEPVAKGKVIAHPTLDRRGRARGSKNRYATVKTDMLWVYKQLGGRREMLKWAKAQNTQEVFYKELLRLIPKELDLETPVGNIRLVMDIDGDSEKEVDAEAATGND